MIQRRVVSEVINSTCGPARQHSAAT